MSFAHCYLCDDALLDDPHWSDALNVPVCDACCDAPGCQELPGGGFVPDDTAGSRPGDRGATRSAVVPATGKSLEPDCAWDDLRERLTRDAAELVRRAQDTPLAAACRHLNARANRVRTALDHLEGGAA